MIETTRLFIAAFSVPKGWFVHAIQIGYFVHQMPIQLIRNAHNLEGDMFVSALPRAPGLTQLLSSVEEKPPMQVKWTHIGKDSGSSETSASGSLGFHLVGADLGFAPGVAAYELVTLDQIT